MRLRRVQVTKLFGQFDHVVELKTQERITIVHGTNGCGKTTILRMIAAVATMNLSQIQPIPFHKATFDFDNGDSLSIERHARPQSPHLFLTPDRTIIHRETAPTFELRLALKKRGRKKPITYTFADDNDIESGDTSELIARFYPWFQKVGYDRWMDHRSGMVLEGRDAWLYASRRYGFEDRLYRAPAKRKSLSDIETYLRQLPVHFIETQRLLRLDKQQSEREKASLTAVDAFAKELSTRIERTLAESAAIAQKQDSAFPLRILQAKQNKALTEQHIRKMHGELELLRKRLSDAGLSSSENAIELPPKKLQQWEVKVLSLYLTDVNKKNAVFTELLDKIELLKGIINARFQHKQLSVSKEKGIVFTLESGQDLPPNALSSGEQHELVLHYQLLFSAKPDTLILIDEPELSLHVTWQRKFLEDIARVSKLAGLDFLIATHSPQIIHDQWHLAIPLGGQDE